MHDFDRTMSELDGWADEGEPIFEPPYHESPLGEGEYEVAFGDDEESVETPFSDEEEMELAAELLTAGSEEDLDHFLGGLLKKAQHAAGRFMKSHVGRSLMGALRGVAKKVLPIAGSVVGSAVPGLGTMVGGALGQGAAKLLAPEDEALSPDEMQFEAARRFVRLAGAAARNAIRDDNGSMPPGRAAQAALMKAARRHAPRLLHHGGATGWNPRAASHLREHGPGISEEYGAFESSQHPCSCPGGGSESLSEDEEMEAASDLLGVTNEHDLANVLGGILKKAVGRNGSFLKKGAGRRIKGALKSVARHTLPNVKRALDAAEGLGSASSIAHDALRTARNAGRLFGLEHEGATPEDQDFEAARRVARLASAAGAHAAHASRTPATGPQVARSAMVKAARQHAPGLLASHGAHQRVPEMHSPAHPARSPHHGPPIVTPGGRWIRKGHDIVLLGACA